MSASKPAGSVGISHRPDLSVGRAGEHARPHERLERLVDANGNRASATQLVHVVYRFHGFEDPIAPGGWPAGSYRISVTLDDGRIHAMTIGLR